MIASGRTRRRAGRPGGRRAVPGLGPGAIGLRVACAAALGVASLGVAAPARSLSLAPLALEDIAASAVAIVRARCVDATPTRRRSGGVDTVARFEVIEAIKGDPGPIVEVRELGGELQGWRTVVPGAPRSRPGDEAILFLDGDGTAPFLLVGSALGYLPVVSVLPGGGMVRLRPRLAAALGRGPSLRRVGAVVTALRRLYGERR